MPAGHAANEDAACMQLIVDILQMTMLSYRFIQVYVAIACTIPVDFSLKALNI